MPVNGKDDKMSIYLGNYDINKIENRLGIKFPDELVNYLIDKKQENAGTLAKDKWHCFDIPFVLSCENMEMATIIHNYLKPLASDMKDELIISIQA
jgi:hypothetical protein